MTTRAGEAGALRRRGAPIALVLLIGLAGGLRLAALERRNLWADEAISWSRARLTPAALVAEMRRTLHPPLYFLALRSWCEAAGGADARTMRLFSVLASLAGVLLLYRLGRTCFSRGVGLAAALLMALSPHQIFFAQEARMYPLATALGLAGALLLVRCVREPKTVGQPSPAERGSAGRPENGIRPQREDLRGADCILLPPGLTTTTRGHTPWLAAYVVVMALGVLTHYIVFLLLAAQVLGAWWGYGRRGLRRALPAVPAVLLLAAPWVASVDVAHARRTQWAPPGSPRVALDRLVGFAIDAGGARFVEQNEFPFLLHKYGAQPKLLAWAADRQYVGERLAALGGAVMLGALTCVALVRLFGRGAGAERRFVGACAFLPLGALAGLLVLRDYPHLGRYLAPFVPYLLLSLAALPIRRRFLAPAVGLLLAAMAVGWTVDRRVRRQEDDYRPVAQWLMAAGAPDEPIIGDPDYMRWSLLYEWGAAGGAAAAVLTDPAEVVDRAPYALWLVADYRSPYRDLRGPLPDFLAFDYDVLDEQDIQDAFRFTNVRVVRLVRR
jgi:4-amino-4-deoxy-L-arabinose transferase-like glycosyltransferase